MQKAFIFDWSGTLIDNFHCWEKVCGLMFTDLGSKPLTGEEIRKHFTLPYMKFWHHFFPDLTFDYQKELYLKHMKKGGSAELFEGVVEILEMLIHKGYKLFILSSDEKDSLLPHIESLGLTHKFTKIIGSIHEKKPVLASLVEQFHLDKTNSFYVGDTSGDVEAGKFAGVKTIGITWGYQDKTLLKNSDPDYIFDTLTDIQTLFI